MVFFFIPFKKSELGCYQETAHLNLVIEGNLIKEPVIKEWVGFREIHKGCCSTKGQQEWARKKAERVTILAGLPDRPMAFCRGMQPKQVTWWGRAGKIKILASFPFVPSNYFLFLLLFSKKQQTNQQKNPQNIHKHTHKKQPTKDKPKHKGASGQNQYRLVLQSTQHGGKGSEWIWRARQKTSSTTVISILSNLIQHFSMFIFELFIFPSSEQFHCTISVICTLGALPKISDSFFCSHFVLNNFTRFLLPLSNQHHPMVLSTVMMATGRSQIGKYSDSSSQNPQLSRNWKGHIP